MKQDRSQTCCHAQGRQIFIKTEGLSSRFPNACVIRLCLDLLKAHPPVRSTDAIQAKFNWIESSLGVVTAPHTAFVPQSKHVCKIRFPRNNSVRWGQSGRCLLRKCAGEDWTGVREAGWWGREEPHQGVISGCGPWGGASQILQGPQEDKAPVRACPRWQQRTWAFLFSRREAPKKCGQYFLPWEYNLGRAQDLENDVWADCFATCYTGVQTRQNVSELLHSR